MSWIRDLFKKQAAPTPMIAMDALPEAKFSDRNYRSYSDEGYQKNVVAYRSINMVSESVGNIRLVLKKRAPGAKSDQEIFNHPAIDLLRKPNATQNYQTLTENAIAYLMLSGNSFIHAVGPNPSAPPRELWTLRPDRMQVVPGRFRLPSQYIYSDGSTKQTFPVDPINGDSAVMHMKTFNPLDDYLGLSPIGAAAMSVDKHNASSKWNLALLQNGARPSGALVVQGEPLTEEQRRSLKSEIETQYANSRRVGRPMVLEGGMDWREMSINPKDMDWIQGRHTDSRDIALAFGTPPMLLGIPGDNTYSNYKEAKQAFYLDTVIPLGNKWAFYLNNWLLPSFGDESLYFCADVNSIEALEPMRNEKFVQVSGAQFLTINEKRELLGYGRYEEGEDPADLMLVPMGVSPIGDLATERPDVDDETLPEDREDFGGDGLVPVPVDQPVSDSALNGAQVTALVDLVARVALGELPRAAAVEIVMVSFLLSREDAERILADAGDGFEVAKPEATDEPNAVQDENLPKMFAVLDGKSVNLSTRGARERYRREVIKRRGKLESRFESQLKAAWTKEQEMMIDAVQGIGIELAEFVVEDVVSKNEATFKRIISDNLERIMRAFGTEILELPKFMKGVETKADPNTRFETSLRQFIELHTASMIQNLSKTTKKRVVKELRRVFSESLMEGETPNAMIKAVKETYSGFRTSRAATIVRTEVGIAQNESQRSAAKALGIKGMTKTWLASPIKSSRESHVAMHEHTIPIDEKFEVMSEDGGVDKMDGPQDPDAPAGQIINCRCVNVFAVNGGEES